MTETVTPGVTSLAEAFRATVERRGDEPALLHADQTVALTWREYGEQARSLATGLSALGVRPGDTVGLLLTNRPELHVADAAAVLLGVTPFSMYNTSAPEQFEHLLTDAGCRVVVTETVLAERLMTAVQRAGYRNRPDATAEAIDADGGLHTGDIARFDDAGHLMIVDRKKELIINAAGKNMSPANIEARLKESSPLIGQACVIGDARPYNVALIVLDAVVSARFADDDARRAEVQAGVERANARLSRVEQIKRFAILAGDWMPDSDELTPTMKLKRRPIAEKYAAEIDALYTTKEEQ